MLRKSGAQRSVVFDPLEAAGLALSNDARIMPIGQAKGNLPIPWASVADIGAFRPCASLKHAYHAGKRHVLAEYLLREPELDFGQFR